MRYIHIFQLLKGNPVICGTNATLEGILTFTDPNRCQRPHRVFLATRVDNYIDLIRNELYIKEKTTTSRTTITTRQVPTEQIIAGPFKFDFWVLVVTASISALIVMGIVGYLIYRWRKRISDHFGAQKKEPVYGVYTLSINLVVPMFLMFSRVALYLQLRESVDRMQPSTGVRRVVYRNPKTPSK